MMENINKYIIKFLDVCIAKNNCMKKQDYPNAAILRDEEKMYLNKMDLTDDSIVKYCLSEYGLDISDHRKCLSARRSIILQLILK